LLPPKIDNESNWPRDFYEALLREDWRDWVQAVKNENGSWAMFEASTEIPYDKMERGCINHPIGRVVLGEAFREIKVPSIR
jgi:hypothetical protein